MMNVKLTADALGGHQALGEIRGISDLSRRVEEGLPYSSFSSFASLCQVTHADLAKVLRIPHRTFIRRRQQGRLGVEESDRLARSARIFVHAARVLGSAEKASRWLGRPNRALAGRAPRDLLQTDAGTHEVEQALGRIEHGVFA